MRDKVKLFVPCPILGRQQVAMFCGVARIDFLYGNVVALYNRNGLLLGFIRPEQNWELAS